MTYAVEICKIATDSHCQKSDIPGMEDWKEDVGSGEEVNEHHHWAQSL